MSDIYNEHRNSPPQSHADILELATALSADGIYYSEREQILNELKSRRFRFKILVDRVSNTYSTVPDESLRKGRTIQGEIVDTEIEVKIQLPDSFNDQADGVSRGDTYEVEGIVSRWVSGLDQFELWGVVPSATDPAPAVDDSTEPETQDDQIDHDDAEVESTEATDPDPQHVESEESLEEQATEEQTADSNTDRGSEEDAAGESADETVDDQESEGNAQDSVTQEEDLEEELEEEQAEVEQDASEEEEPPQSTTEDDPQDLEQDVVDKEPATEETLEETSDESTSASPDDQLAEQLNSLFETDSTTEDVYADEPAGDSPDRESDDVQNTVLKIVAGLGFTEQFSGAEKETNDVASDPFSVSKSKPKDKPTATTRSRSRSQSSSSRLVKGCLIALWVIFGVLVIVGVGAEMLKDAFRTRRAYTHDIAVISPNEPKSSIQTKANEADHITSLITSKQITVLEGAKRLLPKTADNDKAGKIIVQQFAIRPIGISRSIRDELMNAPIEQVVPLAKRLKKAMSHPWSTPQHKPLLRDVINRIETEGADPDADTDADADTDETEGPKIDQKQMARARQLAEFLLDKLDTNADGELSSDEINQADNPKNTRTSDLNKDGKITSKELVVDIYNQIGSQPAIESLDLN